MVRFANPRERHPFHMYEMIHGQANSIAETLRRVEDVEPEALLGRPRHLIITGCGTSFHAAIYGARIFQRAFGPSCVVEAIHAYDLAFGESAPRGAVVLGVSHSGATPTTNRALRRARRKGLRTIGLCGLDDSDMERETSGTWTIGSMHDCSWANTMSYTSQLAAFAALATKIHRESLLGLPQAVRRLPIVVSKTLACEAQVRRLARSVALRERVTILGSELNEVTALEAALKIRETCSLSASGYHTEQFLHGPFLSVDGRESIVMLRSIDDGPRSLIIQRALAAAGARVTSIGDRVGVDIRLPAAHRYLRPILFVIPMQFLAYYAALARHANPDIMRTDIPRLRAGVEALFH